MPEPAEDKKQATQQVTLVGAAVNTFLACAQLTGGFFTGSQALIADGFHTLSDLASDFVVLFAAQHAHKEADDNHPYGHGRIETVATVVLGLMLAAVAVGIFMEAWERLFSGESSGGIHPTALAFAGLAIVSKEALYHYTMRTAKRVRSKLLEANAWHHRSDVVSSVIVLLGIFGTQFGYLWLDGLAAVVIAVMILVMAGRMILDSTLELVDTGMDVARAEEVNRFMASLPGVESVHMLRTRSMGGKIYADAHIQVQSDISVSEGHHIAEYVMQQLKAGFSEISDVTVHIDPEDDEVSKPSAQLPIREEVLAMLRADTGGADLFDKIDKVILHYINGAIHLEVFLKQMPLPGEITGFRAVCENSGYIESVTFYTACT